VAALIPIHVITSCSRAGFEKYGRKAIETLHRFWPQDIPLHLVSEDLLALSPEIGDHRKVIYYNLHQSSVWANEFHVKHKDNPRAHGRGAGFSVKHQDQKKGYSFRHDAYKFSKKVFAIELVARSIGSGRLIWLDADTVTFAGVPRDMLERLPPAEYPIACLDRPGYHSECGFIGYNLDHPDAMRFITEFAALYWGGRVFELQEWHDSWVFDWLRKSLGIHAYGIPHRNPSHPFVHSELGRYMDHMKGARKDHGVSHDHPMCVREGKTMRIVAGHVPEPEKGRRPPQRGMSWTGSGWRQARSNRVKPRRL
jgi:hypothetical protein